MFVCLGGDSREWDEISLDWNQEFNFVDPTETRKRRDQVVRQQQAGRQKEKFPGTTS